MVAVEQNFHAFLVANTPPPSSSPLGFKPTDLRARRKEAERLTSLMQTYRPFCFLRMGDMDLSYLLAMQEDKLSEFQFGEGIISGTLPQGNPGIGPRFAERLYIAFVESDYVDFHERLYPMKHWLPKLRLPRPNHLYRNPDHETSYLSLTWLEFEFKKYCEGRRIGIAGAEARLLEILTEQSIWQNLAEPWWPQEAEIFFHQVRENGQNLDENLDLVKEDLANFINTHQLDTLFLSLGGGAKILCYELSREHGVCCFDFGAMIRALTYSACDGNQAARSTHSPFLFRLPFDLFMDSLEQAFPQLTPEALLAKAHAQLLAEVQFKEVGWTHTAFEYQFSEENRTRFLEAHKAYYKRYKRLINSSHVTRKERADLLHFCGLNRLTLEGQLFYMIFLTKSRIRKTFALFFN